MQVQFDECQVTSDELQVKLDVTGGLRPTGLTAAREAVLGLALAPFDDFLRIADLGLARLCNMDAFDPAGRA